MKDHKKTAMPLVVGIPYAGGDAYAYRALQPYLQGIVEFKVLELPGRGLRRKEKLLTSIHSMAMDIYNQLIILKIDQPYIMFGHSMGALLGFEVCRLIAIAENCGSGELAAPSACFFTGCNAPSVQRRISFSDLPSDELWAKLHRYGGIPEALLQQKEILSYFEPVFRSDFHALESYIYSPSRPKLLPKLVVWWGAQEMIQQNEIQSWEDEFIGGVNMKEVAGNHFFIFENISQIVSEMMRLSKGLTDNG